MGEDRHPGWKKRFVHDAGFSRCRDSVSWLTYFSHAKICFATEDHCFIAVHSTECQRPKGGTEPWIERRQPMKCVIAFAPLLLVGLSIQAQTQASSPTSKWAGPLVFRDAPYFADIISTYDRTTPSGESLHREMRSKIYRDTQGRTRRETEQISPTTGQKLVLVLINDPVSSTVTNLDPRTMTAHILDGSIITPPKQAVRSGPESPTGPPVASSVAVEP